MLGTFARHLLTFESNQILKNNQEIEKHWRSEKILSKIQEVGKF